ncbi:zinc ABC transporter substrate-binding protein [Burkholderia vietnamiensis]|jgi:zinc/manganese transport system substrate-binding protein|uniref:Zinc ABC transporter substrate-binding protein n=1 Tax=Burkholderia vietnamiensis TaxID=60552 RepID=A0AAW7T5G2_BURVI|nr:zinc ABC transporter substrate-binding protein [Burkholderia vietnamiensis]MBR8214068.1 zinc ABC transporter substrate-binding protein [Burkholderia vietnamiensis]MDN7552994.1 zinc ABC transporter substrate-binding protein [Burkholderia vietnamiensis]MDN7797392.1 zinc ABC transporter substrate-binding protein [Burkholderia vietnamiensis]MDN7816002.1 zinc ABC transporter substrate-binding protein [Burkholderia vietnamiensis]HDR9045884.1 zinc ABC transporter substrate-binding protein [Burkhol
MFIALKRAPRRARSLVRLLGVAAAALSIATPALAQSATVNVVAAENFYGDVASQIGGRHVAVTSILSNPDQDPHLFEASPKTARALQHAQIVIYNGANYDPWMAKLLGASTQARRATIVVADLVGKKAGDNPHLWYAPATMPAAARALAAELGRADPAHKADYDANLQKFVASLQPIDAKVAALRAQYHGVPVTATEPVFGYMSDAIGLDMRNQRFQLATMNDTEASAQDVAAFENDLRKRQVRVLIYNSQAEAPMTRRLLKLARDGGVPTVSVTETQPAGKTFQQWMAGQLDALAAALAAGKQ